MSCEFEREGLTVSIETAWILRKIQQRWVAKNTAIKLVMNYEALRPLGSLKNLKLCCQIAKQIFFFHSTASPLKKAESKMIHYGCQRDQ